MKNLALAVALSSALLATRSPAAAGDAARAVAAGAAAKLEAYYVYPSRAREAASLLRRNAASGAYDGLKADALSKRVTDDIATVLHDKHVRLQYSADVLPPAKPSGEGESPEEKAA
ncbi:MAG: hypothetical protein JO036_21080, partial [Candidatus Eremiobacteraeota bacterium]|nr:hypothetical protein [Candidatus Eremiobacteraeota bacterium]